MEKKKLERKVIKMSKKVIISHLNDYEFYLNNTIIYPNITWIYHFV